MSLLDASNNSVSVALDPGINPLIPSATQPAQAVTNDAVGPYAVALQGAAASPSSSSIFQIVNNDPIKYAVFAAMLWFGCRYLRRRS